MVWEGNMYRAFASEGGHTDFAPRTQIEFAPKILPKLRDGTFIRNFRDKGRMSTLLEGMPVNVILQKDTALLGAARYAHLRSEKRIAATNASLR